MSNTVPSKTFSRGGKTTLAYRAFFRCPVCEERGIQSPQTYWYHSTCGGDLYIGEDAYYYCDNDQCGTYGMVMEWGYHCPYHSKAEDDYVGVGDVSHLAQVVGTCMSMTNITGLTWLQNLLAALSLQTNVRYNPQPHQN